MKTNDKVNIIANAPEYSWQVEPKYGGRRKCMQSPAHGKSFDTGCSIIPEDVR